MPQLQHFVVPQFIDIESKILGPITTRQFLWVLGAGLVFFIALRTLSVGTFIIVAIFDVAIFGSFAFIKVNGQLFHNFLLNTVSFGRHPRLYLWSAGVAAGVARAVETPNIASRQSPTHSDIPSRRLSELALLVDTGGTYQPVTSFKDLPPIPDDHAKTI
jgi:hypothetical protein